MTPDQRLQRLVAHARSAWARRDEARLRRAAAWIAAHPSGRPDIDALWLRALAGEGPLAAWLDAGAIAEEWSLDVPLRSVLSCHPFPDLATWSIPVMSRAS